MTDEEKAIEYCGCNQPICRKGFETNGKQNCTCARKKYYLDGLTEGEKIGKEKQWKATEKAQKKTSSKIKELEKENAELNRDKTELVNSVTELENKVAELEKQNEKMKCCQNCKYLTRKLLNCENIQICKVNPNNIYGVCDIWELAE